MHVSTKCSYSMWQHHLSTLLYHWRMLVHHWTASRAVSQVSLAKSPCPKNVTLGWISVRLWRHTRLSVCKKYHKQTLIQFFIIQSYQLQYGGKVWWEKVWQINRSANRLLMISTNLDGFSLANYGQFAKFANVSPRQSFPPYGTRTINLISTNACTVTLTVTIVCHWHRNRLYWLQRPWPLHLAFSKAS